MFKKGVTSLLAISLLAVGGEAAFASTGTTQAQTNEASIAQYEGAATASPVDLFQRQIANNNKSQLQIGSNFGAGQGQAGSVTGAQFQSAATSGPAVLTQAGQTKLKLSDQQTVNGKQQTQSTDADHTIVQSTAVQDPSQVVQGQIGHTAAINLQVSIPGGPTIQHQQAQRTSFQYQVAVKNVAPK